VLKVLGTLNDWNKELSYFKRRHIMTIFFHILAFEMEPTFSYFMTFGDNMNYKTEVYLQVGLGS
jgi:hypothetical protein